MRFRPVTRCVCTQRTFAELKASGLTTADEIAEVYGSGDQCGLCRQYIELMLQTGETEFPLYPPLSEGPDERDARRG